MTTTITIDGREFHYRADAGGDKGAIHQVFEKLDYDITNAAQTMPLLAWLGRQEHPPLIIDAGAHIGCATVWFKNQFPEARIIAIEPEPENFALLSKNTMGMEGVSTVQGAVASYNGTGYLQDPGRGTWGFRVVEPEHSADGAATVKMHTMRTLMRTEPDAVPFIAKIDIEGGEQELFRSNMGWVLAFPLIIIELHDWMIPGRATSRNFFHAIAANDFDVVLSGENLFCFSNELLRAT